MSAEALAVRPGQLIGGRYRVEQLVGEGGYGAIYAAWQLMSGSASAGRRVALKLLHPDVLLRATALARFEREAQLAQSLSHPNTLRLFDFGRTEVGLPFIVYEFLEGQALDRMLAEQGRISALRTARISAQVVKALMEAHAAQIVHRDIKPANVFLCNYAGEPDFVKVVDFGIASIGSTAAGISDSLTREGGSVGTPAYMAPEQALGEVVDGRADLYALGLVMAEAMSGRPVYEGKSGMHVIMQQVANEPAPLPEDVRIGPLGDIIVRATQKNRDARFASAAEMLAALDRMLAAMSAGLSGPSEPPRVVVHAGSRDAQGSTSHSSATQWAGPATHSASSSDFAHAPTVGYAVIPGPFTQSSPPVVPMAPRPGTFSASYLPVPAGPRPSANTKWVAIGLVAALGIFALAGIAAGVGYFYWRGERESASNGESDSDGTSHVKGAGSAADVLRDFSIHGVKAQTILDRMATEGWHYVAKSQVDVGFGMQVTYTFDKNDELATLLFRTKANPALKGIDFTIGESVSDGDSSLEVDLYDDPGAAPSLLKKLVRK